MAVTDDDKAAARAAGFITPVGTDLISGGDDAISNNAALIYKLLRETNFDRGEVPRNSNLNDIRVRGIHTVRTTGDAASLTNWPPQIQGRPGWIFNLTASNGLLTQFVIAAQYSQRQILMRSVISVSSGNLGDWEVVWKPAGDTPSGSGVGAFRHRDMLTRARARRGDVIGTNGKPAVALRFDHHLEPFRDTILPKLIERRLPFALALNPERTANTTTDDNVPWSTIQEWCISNGGEVWNHGGNHGDAATADALRTQIVTSRETLETQLPSLPIEGWAPPGLAEGGYMGAAPFRTVEQNSDTFAGALITGNHAFVAGYAPGVYRTLNGEGLIGAPHVTMDKASLHSIVSALDSTALDGTGVALMLHPNYLGEDGYIDETTFDAILDEIVTRRDAGELEVLTYSGLWVADSDTDRRHSLMNVVGPLTIDGTLTLTWNGNRRDQLFGSTREIRAKITSPNRQVRIRVTGPGLNATYAIVGRPDGTDMAFPFTLPLDHTGDLTVTITAPDDTSILDELSIVAI